MSCMAIHPTGHFFAAGYEDGSIAIWATEDEDKPLSVRSVERVDVNLVNEQLLNLALEPDSSKPSDKPTPESIYKLAWSGYPNSTDPRGGTHTLTVLGGGRGKVSPGVTVFSFSPFNPTDGGTDPKVALPPPMRKAMQDCISNPGVYNYRSERVVSDFLLLPRDTPHFAGNFDPIAIILVCNGGGDRRSICIMDFPPPSLAIVPKRPEMARSTSSSTADVIGEEFAETLHEMQRTLDPGRLTLPNLFWTGSSSVVGGEILALSTDAYGSLCLRDLEASWNEYGLRGGTAWMDGKNDDSMHAKVRPQPPARHEVDRTSVVRAPPGITYMAQRPYNSYSRYQPTVAGQLRGESVAGIIPETPSISYDRPVQCFIRPKCSRAMFTGCSSRRELDSCVSYPRISGVYCDFQDRRCFYLPAGA